jgi:hypothetical protein
MSAHNATSATAAIDTAAETQHVRPKVVYADCRMALEIAWRDGLPRDVPVRSVAPAVLADAAIGAQPAVERLGPPDIALLSEAFHATVHEVWQLLRDDPALTDVADAQQVGLTAVRTVLIDLQNEVFSAALLREEDFGAETVAIAVRHESTEMCRRFYFSAAHVLAEMGQAQIIEVAADKLPAIGEPAPPKPPLWPRLSHLGSDTATYRLGMMLYRFLPFAAPRGGVFILRENELVKETAARLLRRGYGLYGLARPNSGEISAGPLEAVIEETVQATIVKNFNDLVAARALEYVAQKVARVAVANLRRYRASLSHWHAIFESVHARRPRAVLTNMLLTPQTLGLHRVLQQRGIPLVAFQHGVTPEISADSARSNFSFDNVGCDLAITFNEEMARLCENSPYSAAPAFAVGLPRDYQRAARRRGRTNTIWYVSTSLYQSNIGRLHRGLVDADIYTRERALIDEVFARLPHGVVYKPYPAHRYLDHDPLVEHAEQQANMVVHRDRLDLRYLAREARILLTCGASSTVSRCLMSGRPTVFINSPENTPLREVVLSDFTNSIFVFDGGAPDFHTQLREFLSQPFEAIERAWVEKGVARQRLIENYFSAPYLDPAGRAADAVVAKIGKRQ